MEESKDFDLSDVMVSSLCFNDTTRAPTRPMFHQKQPSTHYYVDHPLKILGEVDFKESKEVPEHKIGTPIQEFFRGANIFITGGSGFLGKILTEKLIRAIPHIGHIYILIRPKRGKTSQERLDMLLEDKVFSRMKAEKPGYRSKITALAGDLSEEGLGLRVEDRQLLQESIHVVFHCAADIRFLEPLRNAIASNVLGSKRVMDCAREMIMLKAYIHVSTAYSHCVHRVIEENVPKMSMNYKDILNYVETNTDSHIEHNLKWILQGWPNTYTFSKAVCEDMIQEEAKGLPITIFRPSVVMTTLNEPVKGWTDNLNGPAALLLAVALGLVHICKVNGNLTTDLVPVDYVVSCMIATAWHTSKTRDRSSIQVCNFTSSSQNMMTYSVLLNNYKRVTRIWPYHTSIWHPSLICTDNVHWRNIFSFFAHTVPGHILDRITPLFGQKPRLVKVYTKVSKSYDVVEYFLYKFWEFKNENAIKLWNSMVKEDKELFKFDVREINWVEYLTEAYLGLRYYYIKESMETIPAARNKYKWLRLAHNVIKISFGYLALKLAVEVAHLLPI